MDTQSAETPSHSHKVLPVNTLLLCSIFFARVGKLFNCFVFRISYMMESGASASSRIFYAAFAANPYPSEEHRVDPKDDTSKPFNRIHLSCEHFREQLAGLADRATDRSLTSDVVRNLWFLSISQASDVSKVSSSQHGGLSGSEGTMTLSLEEHTPASGPLDYVAVSYCWLRDAMWFADLHLGRSAVHARGKQVVDAEPADVLYRASSYAIRHKIPRIWIDQYCIDHTDPADKATQIQNMDIVYQHSARPVAVLETCIEMQDQLDAFAKIFRAEELRGQELDDLEEVLSMLAEDAWFKRAWTLQEAVAAGTNMILLIGCPPGLIKPNLIDRGGCVEPPSFSADIEVELSGLLDAMITARMMIEECLATDEYNSETAVSISNLADKIYNFLPNVLSRDFVPGEKMLDLPLNRQICTAAEVVNLLQPRLNSIFSDRLAILGNMCNYKIRLPASCIDENGASFSTCVFALAILNGDTSLLGRYTDPYSRSYLSRDGSNSGGLYRQVSDLAYEVFGFSWGPPPTAALRNIEYFNQHDEIYHLQPSTLSRDGLCINGVLWLMDERIALPRTHGAFAPAWQREVLPLDFASDAALTVSELDDRVQPMAQRFICALLEELAQTGYRDLARTLWSYFQPRVSRYKDQRSRKGPFLYSFEDVFERRSVSATEIIRRAHLHRVLLSELGDSGIPTIMRTIMAQVLESGTLLCGRPVRGGRARVYFEECAAGDLVLTPWTALGDAACFSSVYRSQAVSWKVRRSGCERPQGQEILQSTGRRRGIYRMDDLASEIYVLKCDGCSVRDEAGQIGPLMLESPCKGCSRSDER